MKSTTWEFPVCQDQEEVDAFLASLPYWEQDEVEVTEPEYYYVGPERVLLKLVPKLEG